MKQIKSIQFWHNYLYFTFLISKLSLHIAVAFIKQPSDLQNWGSSVFRKFVGPSDKTDKIWLRPVKCQISLVRKSGIVLAFSWYQKVEVEALLGLKFTEKLTQRTW